MAGEYPDVVVGCVGGGSNFAGLSYPFVRRNLRDGADTRFVAAEPAACPTLTRGRVPLRLRRHRRADPADADVHAGPRLRAAAGARRRAALPRRRAEPVRRSSRRASSRRRRCQQTAAFDAAVRFARIEGIIPGPEPAHALRAAFDEAEEAKQAGEERVILIGLSGHGHFDMSAYEAYLVGRARGPRVLRGRHGGGAGAPARRARPRVARRIPLTLGEVSEWLKERDWKSRGRR